MFLPVHTHAERETERRTYVECELWQPIAFEWEGGGTHPAATRIDSEDMSVSSSTTCQKPDNFDDTEGFEKKQAKPVSVPAKQKEEKGGKTKAEATKQRLRSTSMQSS